MESQNHCGWKRPPRPSSPEQSPPCQQPRKLTPHPVIPWTPAGMETLNLPGQPHPMPDHPSCEEIPPESYP